MLQESSAPFLDIPSHCHKWPICPSQPQSLLNKTIWDSVETNRFGKPSQYPHRLNPQGGRGENQQTTFVTLGEKRTKGTGTNPLEIGISGPTGSAGRIRGGEFWISSPWNWPLWADTLCAKQSRKKRIKQSILIRSRLGFGLFVPLGPRCPQNSFWTL